MQVDILLVSSGNLSEYNGTVSSIKTIDSSVATWANVSMRIIEEQKQLKSNLATENIGNARAILGARRGGKRTTRKEIECWNCNRQGHLARDCWRGNNK